ncbi:SAM-dependent methyltransferase [Sphingomonas hankookensis]|uniref:SAM-dependent methyltransferase n=1 Tax=Sphingomonas hankookensis TaxID=563996 RepID=UPI00234F7FFA|nr:SAM-dependent methyltransferase [Sphingomonas hankookensis]WCP73921.1 SAM-dependent methyltransferase [Sphingomonas hankookensis]
MRTALRIAPAPRQRRTHPAPVRRSVRADPRWPQIVAALQELRDAHRHAVRIVDADCACGTLLIEVARHARVMGFTAIEGRGIDGSPALIGRARAAAARLHDPAIGLAFDMIDLRTALLQEAEAPADLLLWHGARPADATGMAPLLAAAATRVIADAERTA